MANRVAQDIFCGFEASDEQSAQFLAEVFLSPECPTEERDAIQRWSLQAGHEDWNLQLLCAAAIQHKRLGSNRHSLAARDVLAFIPTHSVEESASKLNIDEGWAETDQLIQCLRESLQHSSSGFAIEGNQNSPASGSAKKYPATKMRRVGSVNSPSLKSHYWDDDPSVVAGRRPPDNEVFDLTAPGSAYESNTELASEETDVLYLVGPTPMMPRREQSRRLTESNSPGPAYPAFPREGSSSVLAKARKRSPVKSHFFAPPTPETPTLCADREKTKSKRPQAGIVSAIPFPPLTAPCFSLIQEEVADEPFWLLIAVTFLIKTAGKIAIPIFHKVKSLYPTPAALADTDATKDIQELIRHLGLSVVRTAAIQRYARGWLKQAPQPGVRYRVRGYEAREDMLLPIVPCGGPNNADGDAEDFVLGAQNKANGDEDGWEIGHLTQGRYSIDSWRIFCRDKLLGRAGDWNGKGAPPEFQPEWMRVQPQDKELRACLRWMWMREGWEWDPETGEKTVLRPEMARAVNEGRVEYDNAGGLRIVDEEVVS